MSGNSTHQDTSATFNGYAIMKEGSHEFVPYSYHPRPLGPNEIEVKITHCGICASDLHTAFGGWGKIQYPIIVGHEIVGHITQKGSEVSDSEFKIGDRVGCGAMCGACMGKQKDCKACPLGHENYCKHIIGTYNSKYPDGEPALGGYCSHKRWQKDLAFHIPKELSSEEAAPLLCAGATVWAPLVRFPELVKGKKVGVIGVGGLGHLAVQFAAKLGADVAAIGTSKSKEKLAKELGASYYLDINDEADVKKHKDYFDLIICTANADKMPWSLYLSLTAGLHGVFALVALPEKPIPIMPFDMVSRRVTFVGSSIANPKEINEMFQFAAKNNIKAMVEVMPLSDVNIGVHKVETNNVKFRVVLEIPQ